MKPRITLLCTGCWQCKSVRYSIFAGHYYTKVGYGVSPKAAYVNWDKYEEVWH